MTNINKIKWTLRYKKFTQQEVIQIEQRSVRCLCIKKKQLKYQMDSMFYSANIVAYTEQIDKEFSHLWLICRLISGIALASRNGIFSIEGYLFWNCLQLWCYICKILERSEVPAFETPNGLYWREIWWFSWPWKCSKSTMTAVDYGAINYWSVSKGL